jgi:hypothetical protein
MFVALVAGIVALAVFLPASRDVTSIVTPLVATFTSLSVMVGGWVVVRRVADKVDEVKEIAENTAADTAELTNGVLQARVESIARDSVIQTLRKRQDDES